MRECMLCMNPHILSEDKYTEGTPIYLGSEFYSPLTLCRLLGLLFQDVFQHDYDLNTGQSTRMDNGWNISDIGWKPQCSSGHQPQAPRPSIFSWYGFQTLWIRTDKYKAYLTSGGNFSSTTATKRCVTQRGPPG